MNEWRTVSLGDLAESIDYGVTASATEKPMGPKFLRITDIQNGSVNWDIVPWCECDTRSASKARLKPGDIVFARTGATTGKSFLIRECPIDSVFASYLIRLRLADSVEPRFISHFFQTPNYWAQITQRIRGVAQPGVNATKLGDIQVPVPPLAAQRRIAEVLDRAEALRVKRRAALEQFNALTQSIFLDLFGEPRSDSKRWPIVPLEQIVRETRLGLVRGSQEFGSDFPIPYVRMNAITRSGELELAGVQRTNATAVEIDTYRLKPGDFLFNTRNSEELVGKTALYREDGLHLFNNNLMRIRFNDKADSEFVSAAFKTSFVQRELQLRKSGTTNVFAIYYKDLRSLPLPLPPVTLQREFARQVSAVEKLKATQRASLVDMEALFVSLQHRAFQGEL